MPTLTTLIAKVQADLSDFNRGMDQVDRRINLSARDATQLGRALTAAVTLPIAGLIKLAVGFDDLKYRSQIAFTTMLGSGRAATQMLEDLQKFAVATPFEFPDLIRTSQRLMAMGFQGKQVMPVLQAVGDAVAALGGQSDVLDRVTYALGQMNAQGYVTGYTMRQLTMAGIPAWDILSKAIGKTTSEVMVMSRKGLIPAKWAIDTLINGMEARFPQMMQKISGSVLVSLSNLKDASIQALGSLFEPLSNQLAKFLQEMSVRALQLRDVFKKIPESTREMITELVLVAGAAGPTLLALSGLARVAVMAASPVGVLSAAVIALTGYLVTHREEAQKVADFFRTHWVEAYRAAQIATLVLATVGIARTVAVVAGAITSVLSFFGTLSNGASLLSSLVTPSFVAFGGAVVATVEALSLGLVTFGGAISAIAGAIAGNPVVLITGVILLIGALAAAWATNFMGIQQITNDTIKALTPVFQAWELSIKTSLASVYFFSGLVGDLFNGLGDLWNAFVDLNRRSWQNLVETAGRWGERFRRYLPWLVDAWNWFTGALGRIFAHITGMMGQFVGGLLGMLGQLGQGIATSLSNAVEGLGLGQKIKESWGRADSDINGIKKGVTDFSTSVGGAFKGAGKAWDDFTKKLRSVPKLPAIGDLGKFDPKFPTPKMPDPGAFEALSGKSGEAATKARIDRVREYIEGLMKTIYEFDHSGKVATVTWDRMHGVLQNASEAQYQHALSLAKEIDELTATKKLTEDYKNVIEGLIEKMTLGASATEMARLQYRLTEGDLKGLTDAEKQHAIELQKRIDENARDTEIAQKQSQIYDNAAETIRDLYQSLALGAGASEKMRLEWRLTQGDFKSLDEVTKSIIRNLRAQVDATLEKTKVEEQSRRVIDLLSEASGEQKSVYQKTLETIRSMPEYYKQVGDAAARAIASQAQANADFAIEKERIGRITADVTDQIRNYSRELMASGDSSESMKVGLQILSGELNGVSSELIDQLMYWARLTDEMKRASDIQRVLQDISQGLNERLYESSVRLQELSDSNGVTGLDRFVRQFQSQLSELTGKDLEDAIKKIRETYQTIRAQDLQFEQTKGFNSYLADIQKRLAELTARSGLAQFSAQMMRINEQGRLVQIFTPEQLKRMYEAQKVLNQMLEQKKLWETFAAGLQDIFSNMFNDLFENGFKNFFQNIVQGFEQLLQKMAVQYLTSQIVNLIMKTISGLVGGPAAGLSFGGMRAEGGPVSSGMAYIVGERGPELFVPGASGQIVPNGAGGPAPVIRQTFNIQTPDARSFRKAQSHVARDAARAAEIARRRNR